MQSTRSALEAEIIRKARLFVECFDGFEAFFGVDDGDAFMRWHELSITFTHYDMLYPAEITGTSHTANADGPDTQHEAAVLAQPSKAGTSRQIIDQLLIVEHQGYSGLTDQELEHRLRKPHTTVSSARNWLMNAGWIADCGRRRATISKREAIVWQLTPAAHQHLKSNNQGEQP